MVFQEHLLSYENLEQLVWKFIMSQIPLFHNGQDILLEESG